jgi:hypothetical protein
VTISIVALVLFSDLIFAAAYLLLAVSLLLEYVRTRRRGYLIGALILTAVSAFTVYGSVLRVTTPGLLKGEVSAAGGPSLFWFLAQLGGVAVLIATISLAISIRRLIRIRAAQRRELERAKIQALAAQHPELVETIDVLRGLFDEQSRSSWWQNAMLGSLFFILGVLATLVISALTSPH